MLPLAKVVLSPGVSLVPVLLNRGAGRDHHGQGAVMSTVGGGRGWNLRSLISLSLGHAEQVGPSVCSATPIFLSWAQRDPPTQPHADSFQSQALTLY